MRHAAWIAALLFASTVLATEMPRRKSGLWHITMERSRLGALHFQACVDQNTDRLVDRPSAGCSRYEMRRDRTWFMWESVCEHQGTTLTTRGTFTGNFETSYRGEIEASYQEALGSRRAHLSKYEARWIGPCKPGQKPGDTVRVDASGREPSTPYYLYDRDGLKRRPGEGMKPDEPGYMIQR